MAPTTSSGDVILVQTYGALAAAFFVYLVACGMTDVNVDRRVVTGCMCATLAVGCAVPELLHVRQLKSPSS